MIMKVCFEMDKEILCDAIDAINQYLEMCDSPVVMCENLTATDKQELQDSGELCFAAALVGDEFYKIITAQTEDMQ